MRLICVLLAIVVVARAAIPYTQVDVQLYDDPTFEADAHRALGDAKAAIQQSTATGTPAKPFVPHVAEILNQGLQKLVDGKSNTVWQTALMKTITDEKQRAAVQAKVTEISATFQTMTQNFRTLDQAKDLKETNKVKAVHAIHTDIQKLLNIFADENSVFKSYPQLAIRPLSALATVIGIFNPILQRSDEALATSTFSSCKLNDILVDYRNRLALQRFQKLDASVNVKQKPTNIDIAEIKGDVITRPYNKEGYQGANGANIKCAEINDCAAFQCMKDAVTTKKYKTDAKVVSNVESMNCFTDYLELLRFRIEKAFDEPIEVTESLCPEEVRTKRRTTGQGWLTMIVNNTHAVGSISRWCGPTSQTKCSVYVRISIDEKEVLKTKTKTVAENNWATFYEIYTSKKIPKSSQVKVELIAENLQNGNNQLIRQQFPVRRILGTFTPTANRNSVSVISTWLDEYQN